MFHKALVGSMMLISPELPVLSCLGPGDDGRDYRVAIHLDPETEKPRRVVVEQAPSGLPRWEPVAQFSHYEDLTPAQPTDVDYLFSFRHPKAGDGDLSILVMGGGFTQLATAQAITLGGEDPPAFATMPCLPGGHEPG